MPTYTYRNVFNTLFYASLALGCTSKHFHHTNRSLGPVDLVLPWWTSSKEPFF